MDNKSGGKHEDWTADRIEILCNKFSTVKTQFLDYWSLKGADDDDDDDDEFVDSKRGVKNEPGVNIPQKW